MIDQMRGALDHPPSATRGAEPAALAAEGNQVLVTAGIALDAQKGKVTAPNAAVTIGQVQSIITEHCAVCHSTTPTQPGFAAPPGGYLFRTPADIDSQAALVGRSLASGYMPLGNITGLLDEERAVLMSWVAGEGR